MLGDYIELTFDNSITTTDLLLCVVGRPDIPSPEMDYEVINVRGRRGSVYRKYEYNDIAFSVTFNYLEDLSDRQTFKKSMWRIRKVIQHAKELRFSDVPDVYYLVRQVHIQDAKNDIEEYGEFTVNFTCYPFGFVAEDFPIVFKATNNAIATSFNVETFEDCEPVITIIGNGDINMVLNSKVYTFKNVEGQITIDSFRKIAYKQAGGGIPLNHNNKMLTPYFPKLVDGENVLNITGTGVAEVRIIRNMLV